MDKSELQFYSRQIQLPNFGIAGQKQLKKSNVLVIGAGGLGSSALQYLAAAGVGNIGICDFDKLDVSNLHRQIIYDFSQTGFPKAELAKKNILRLNPYLNIQIIDNKISAANVEEVISQYDVVLDCTDNFNTKFLIHDACYLNRINLIQSSIYQFEGQLHVFKFAEETNAGCFRCLWQTIPEEGCVGTCGEVGVLGVVPGIFGTLQALEAIKLLLGWKGLPQGKTFIFDLLSLQSRTIGWKKSETCPICGKYPYIKSIKQTEYENMQDYEIYSSAVNIDDFELIDVRDEATLAEKFSNDFNIHHISLNSWGENLPNFDAEKQYLAFCNYGIKSKEFVRRMREVGYINVFSLKDGAAGVKKLLKVEA